MGLCFNSFGNMQLLTYFSTTPSKLDRSSSSEDGLEDRVTYDALQHHIFILHPACKTWQCHTKQQGPSDHLQCAGEDPKEWSFASWAHKLHWNTRVWNPLFQPPNIDRLISGQRTLFLSEALINLRFPSSLIHFYSCFFPGFPAWLSQGFVSEGFNFSPLGGS